MSFQCTSYTSSVHIQTAYTCAQVDCTCVPHEYAANPTLLKAVTKKSAEPRCALAAAWCCSCCGWVHHTPHCLTFRGHHPSSRWWYENNCKRLRAPVTLQSLSLLPHMWEPACWLCHPGPASPRLHPLRVLRVLSNQIISVLCHRWVD